jgi:hypothetical protein
MNGDEFAAAYIGVRRHHARDKMVRCSGLLCLGHGRGGCYAAA